MEENGCPSYFGFPKPKTIKNDDFGHFTPEVWGSFKKKRKEFSGFS